MLRSPVMRSLIALWIVILCVSVYMVTISSSKKAVLTEKDYYQQGIQYEQVVDAKHRAQSLGSALAFTFDSAQWEFSIGSSNDNPTPADLDSVLVECMRFNNSAQDTVISLIKTSPGRWNQTGYRLSRGNWKITLRAYKGSQLWLFIEQDFFKQ